MKVASSRRPFAIALFLILLLNPVRGLWAQGSAKAGEPQNPRPLPTNEVEIQMIWNEQPVSGASVWLEYQKEGDDGEKDRIVVPAKITPDDGIVRFPLNQEKQLYHIYAKKGHDLFSLASVRMDETVHLRGANRLRLPLYKTDTASGILYFENKPLADATCKISYFMNLRFRNEYHGLVGAYIPTPKGLSGATYEVKTGPDGKFSIPGIPGPEIYTMMQISKPELGTSSLSLRVAKANDAMLMPAAKLALSIEGETSPLTIDGFQLDYLPDQSRTPDSSMPKIYLMPKTDRSLLNQAKIPGILTHSAGTYSLSFPIDPARSFYFGPPQEVRLESGKTTSLVLKKIPLACCKGRIVDAKTGKGIPHLPIQLKGTKEWMTMKDHSEFENVQQKFSETIQAKTDESGKFSIACKGNHVYTLHFGEGQDNGDNQSDYEYPFWDVDVQKMSCLIPHLKVGEKETVSFPEIRLNQSRVITGSVRHDGGKPVEPPFEVICLARETSRPKPAYTENGKFTLSQLRPDVPLKVFVRKGHAVNRPQLIPVEDLDAPLALSVSENNQVHCKGKVVDETGNPIPKARVSLVWVRGVHCLLSHGTIPLVWEMREMEYLETDDQGRFAAHGLWPGERYYVRIRAKGFQNWTPPNEGGKSGESAECGETIDFGNTVLKKN